MFFTVTFDRLANIYQITLSESILNKVHVMLDKFDYFFDKFTKLLSIGIE